ncbi:putative MFS family arabinose efflux permease [Delftia acidovorans]|uniref:MFS transporter n=1 Tax=Delftia acidovorans TaxID=80866 RepID=UPI000F4B5543|nr:MFS transporter [Delftia acidovorans]ROQ92880.1 putative MFS family arabinose efflux permease [Delftia acidovorans]
MNSSSSARAEPAARRPWLAVSAVGLATFSVVTTEMLPVGLLTSIAGSLGTSMGRAGLMISLPALLAALFAPLVVMAAGGMDRRRILCGLLALLVLANLASTLAPSLIWLLAARVLVGFCMGGIWAIAGGLAARLVPQASMGLATSIIFGGVAAASVLGVPLGALIGDFAGWRWAFGGMAGFSALVLALHVAVLPSLPATGSANLRQFSHQLANRRLQAGLALTLLLVAGHFMAFTFVRPLLLTVSGFDAQWMSALLLAYGIAGIAGNFLAGIIAARRTVPSLTAIAMGLLLAPVLFLSMGDSPTGGGAVLLVWGLAYGGVSVGLMTWMMQAAPRAVEIATALYVGVFNIGIALGSWAGGQLVDGWGLHATLWLSGGFAAAALLLSAAMGLVGRNGPVAA